MEKKKRLRLKTEKIDGEEMVVMECATCHRRENVEADIAFECWEFDGGPFVRLSVLRDGNDDSEAGDRGNEGSRRKRKAPGQTEKKKKLNVCIRL